MSGYESGDALESSGFFAEVRSYCRRAAQVGLTSRRPPPQSKIHGLTGLDYGKYSWRNRVVLMNDQVCKVIAFDTGKLRYEEFLSC